MGSKKDERHQLAEAAEASGSFSPRRPAATGSTDKPLKRSVPEEHRHNTQAPAEKKPKQKAPTDGVKNNTPATTSGGDHANATQKLSQPESAHANAGPSTHPPSTDLSKRVSDPLVVDARAGVYWRNVAMTVSRAPLGIGPPPYNRPTDPTNNELYIFVTALRSYLSQPARSINRQGLMIMGDYLMQRGVLARLKGRADYNAMMRNTNLAPKLVALEQIALQALFGYLYKALEEGKITVEDIARWKQDDAAQQHSPSGHEPGKT
ncbi:MAG: hypothetical protein Q9195_003757 [Heterodermia aff. obscurata]